MTVKVNSISKSHAQQLSYLILSISDYEDKVDAMSRIRICIDIGTYYRIWSNTHSVKQRRL